MRLFLVLVLVSKFSTINGEINGIFRNENKFFVEQMMANARRVMDIYYQFMAISNQQVSQSKNKIIKTKQRNHKFFLRWLYRRGWSK